MRRWRRCSVEFRTGQRRRADAANSEARRLGLSAKVADFKLAKLKPTCPASCRAGRFYAPGNGERYRLERYRRGRYSRSPS